jgi:hypothetical protein
LIDGQIFVTGPIISTRNRRNRETAAMIRENLYPAAHNNAANARLPTTTAA